MQAEQDKTYTIGDEELAIVANALWTDGVHVEFEDIQTACRRYPGDLTTVTAKLRDWVTQGKPTGTFCELSEEEHFRSVVEACDARPESWELALRVTKKFPQVPLGVTVNIALLIDGLDVIPQEDCDMIPFLSQLTMGKLSQILCHGCVCLSVLEIPGSRIYIVGCVWKERKRDFTHMHTHNYVWKIRTSR